MLRKVLFIYTHKLTDEVCRVVVQGTVQANTAEVLHHVFCRTTVGHLHSRSRRCEWVHEDVHVCVCMCVCK